MFHFRIRTLLIVVAFVAVGMTALVNASLLWIQIVSTVVTLVLMWAALVVFLGLEQNRGFAIGFLVGGLGYAGLNYFSDDEVLLTHWLHGELYSLVAVDDPAATQPIGLGGGMGMAMGMGGRQSLVGITAKSPDIACFNLVANYLWTAIIGYVVGLIGSHLHKKRLDAEGS